MARAAGPAGVRRRRSDGITLAVSAALVVPMAVVANREPVPQPERVIFAAINGLPDRWAPGMYAVQLAGLVGVPIGLAVFAAAWRRPPLALALALSLPAKELVEHGVLKQLVERSRPAQNEPGAVLRYRPATEGLAFPSGHAIVAFMVAGLLAPYLPRPAAVALFALAVLVGVSRVYLGAHNPLDVLAGAAVGLALAASLNLVLGVPAGPGIR